MKHKVVNKQYISKDCFICGIDNKSGLGVRFFELENGDVVGEFTARVYHQSYPGRVHGGVLSALLDEAMGRAISITEPETFAVTVDMSISFKKPVPYDTKLLVVGRVTENSKRVYEGYGEIILPDGQVAAIGSGKYFKMPINKIAKQSDIDGMLFFLDEENDPKEIEY